MNEQERNTILADYQPLLAHLTEPSDQEEECGHKANEDCMFCSGCDSGCREDLGENDLCSDCRAEPDEENQPAAPEPATPGE